MQKQCRFCLETDKKENLISPCLCRGTFKYVHNKCLMEWFHHEPERGLRCSACLEPFAQKPTIPLENIPKLNFYLDLHLQKPLAILSINHWFFIAIAQNVSKLKPFSFQEAYYMYQVMFHILFFYILKTYTSQVKNRKLYASMWLRNNRILLPLVHVYFLLTMSATSWIGGISADMCMMYYFYEHFEILYSINENYEFSFTSR